MNKKELSDALAELHDLSHAEAGRIVGSVFKIIQDAVAEGDKVAIAGFGAWEKVTRGARTMRNPKTGATVDVPAKDVPKFRAGAGFANHVNGDGE